MNFKKIKYPLLILLFSFFLSGCTVPFLPAKKKAALKIDSEPTATVFINGEHVGRTPFLDENLKEGELVVKIVPEDSGSMVGSWEGRVKLVNGIMTVVSRHLAVMEEDASGYILTLDPTANKDKCSLSVVSTPDKGIVTVNGEPKGFAPLPPVDLTEGDYNIAVSLPGYKEMKLTARAINGYRLLITVQLARDKTTEEPKESTDSAKLEDEKESEQADEDSDSDTKKATSSAQLNRPYVVIASPDIGWVRVRAEASTTSEELAKVNDGESYKLLDTTLSGWYQIEYATDKEGWISGKYAEKYE